MNCAAGSYRAEGEKCEKCDRGTYQPDQGQLSCSPCAKGFTTPHSGSVKESSCYFIGLLDQIFVLQILVVVFYFFL